MEDIEKYGESEISERHRFTAVNFLRYCYGTLLDIFVNKGTISESSEHSFLLGSLLGYEIGVENFGANKFQSLHDFPKIKTIFTKSEFEQIGILLKETLIQLPKQAQEALEWMLEFGKHESVQLHAIDLFMTALTTEPGRQKDEAVSASRDFLEKIQPEVLGKYSLLRTQALEKIGIYTPAKEMIITINRIMNMMDVLHYGGYIINANKSNDPSAMTIKKFL